MTDNTSGFDDYEEFAEPLRLPVRGKTYTIPEATLSKARIMHQFMANPDKIPKDLNTDEKFSRFILTDAVYDELIADDVPVPALTRMVSVVSIDVVQGRVAALAAWKVGRSPEALAAVMAAAARLTAGIPAPEANETPTENPSSGSTNPTADTPSSSSSGSAPKTKRAPRSGRRSSATGDASKSTSSGSTTTASTRRTRGGGSAT